MVLPDRSRPRPRGFAYDMVGAPSPGSAGPESVPGDTALARFLAQSLARFLAQSLAQSLAQPLAQSLAQSLAPLGIDP